MSPVDVGATGSGGAGGITAPVLNPLCGQVPRECNPDNETACSFLAMDAGSQGGAAAYDAGFADTGAAGGGGEVTQRDSGAGGRSGVDAGFGAQTSNDAAVDQAAPVAADAATDDGAQASDASVPFDARPESGRLGALIAVDARPRRGLGPDVAPAQADAMLARSDASAAPLRAKPERTYRAEREAGAPRMGCRVLDDEGTALAACAPVGNGRSGAPCSGSTDCGPGLTCVGSGTAGGSCRRFCCGGQATCEEGSFCAESPLFDSLRSSELLVPVCIPATSCSLDEPYPCSDPAVCGCVDDTVCTVIKDDGSTSCLPPGDVALGGACTRPSPGGAGSCAPGYFCGSASVCVELCRLNEGVCASGTCYGAPGLQTGWGVCIGG